MTTPAIDATIFASSHPDIAKRTSVSGLIFSGIMLLIGVLAFISTFEMEDRSSTLSMGLMVLGTGLFLIGIFLEIKGSGLFAYGKYSKRTECLL